MALECVSVDAGLGGMVWRTNIDSPNRLISHDNLTPVLDLVRNSLELRRHNLNRLARLALLQTLTTAQNHAEPAVQRRLGLARNELVVLLENDTALRVAQNRPRDAAVLELVGGDLAREGAARLVEDVLCGDFEAFVQVLAGEEEVEGWWGDDDLCVVVVLENCFCDWEGRAGMMDGTHQCWDQASRCSGCPESP